MKSTFIFAALVLPFFSIGKELPKKESISFTENKGQVHDQNNQPRPDVLFSGSANGLVYHLKKDGISYQLNKVTDKTEIYRIDINWLNVNSNVTIEKGSPEDGVANFYLENCPNGALNVKSYKNISYKNIYDRIDLKWYEKNGELEYDFIVAPNSDYNQIKIQIKGAEKLSINQNGDLEIKTPFGVITEHAPIAYQGNKSVVAKWSMGTDDEVVGIRLGNYNPALPITIDPVVRVWGTYYGTTGPEYSNYITTDASGNLFIAGSSLAVATNSILATTGAHQTSIGAVTKYDAYLAKFNASGVRQWGTYYGGTEDDKGNSCSTDAAGNVYLCGTTTSSLGTVMATAGSHQPTYGGGLSDAYLVKFNSAGVRQWGTYYGSTADEMGESCSSDGAGNVYLALTGATAAGTIITTVGSHQAAFGGGGDMAFIKFNTAGVRQWGTYYGGAAGEIATACKVNPAGTEIYLLGAATNVATGTIVATTGAYQTTYGGGTYDIVLVKFNSSGVRQWGTYYGGTATEYPRALTVDGLGNATVCGQIDAAVSGTVIASAGAFQSAFSGGSNDGIIAKFNASGSRMWGTFYGGTSVDYIMGCTNDASGNLLVVGSTNSAGNVFGTLGSHQPVKSSGYDAFISKFDFSGNRVWGSYYGGTGSDNGSSCTTFGTGDIYFSGYTTSSGGIATASAHQPTLSTGGSDDAFLTKLFDCTGTFTVSPNYGICQGQTITLSGGGTGVTSYSWSTGSTSPSIAVSPTVSGTGYTITVSTATALCTYSAGISIGVFTLPFVGISGTPSVCLGGSTTLTVTGADTYSWSTSATTTSILVTPTITTSYSVIGTSSATGCSNSDVRTVTVVPLPTLTVSGTSTICNGNSTTLTVSGASTYSWNTSATTNSITVTPTTTTSYSVTGTMAGCSSTISKNVTVYSIPSVSLTVSSNTACTASTGGVNIILAGSPAGGVYSGVGVSGNSLTPQASAGTYTAVYTYTDSTTGCTNNSFGTVSVSVCTGLNEIANEGNIFIYPNPSNGEFTIKGIEGKVEIINSIGQTVYASELNADELKVSGLSADIYYLRIENVKGSKKIVVVN